MDKAHENGNETRQRLAEARAATYREQTALKQAARVALQRVTENPDTTPDQRLEAARLLVELSGR